MSLSDWCVVNRSAWRSQSSVKERCASRPAQWITVRERDIIRHTPSHAAPQQNTLDPQTHTSQGLVLRAFSAFRNETQSARSHMYIGIRDGYLTRRWPLCACVHLSHSSRLTSPGWGPYSLLASGQAHFTAGHDKGVLRHSGNPIFTQNFRVSQISSHRQRTKVAVVLPSSVFLCSILEGYYVGPHDAARR